MGWSARNGVTVAGRREEAIEAEKQRTVTKFLQDEAGNHGNKES